MEVLQEAQLTFAEPGDEATHRASVYSITRLLVAGDLIPSYWWKQKGLVGQSA